MGQRFLLSIVLSTFLIAPGISAAVQSLRDRAALPIVNAAGQVLLTAEGTQRNYSREEWQYPAKALIAASPALNVQAGSVAGPVAVKAKKVLAKWGYAGFGTGIGLSGIVLGTNNGNAEIYLGGTTSVFGSNDYWYALAYDSASQDYRQIYVSHYVPAGIARILLAQRHKGADPMIVIAMKNGKVELYNQKNKRLIESYADPCKKYGGIAAMAVEDLNGDGNSEFLSVCARGTLMVYGKNYSSWSVSGVSGSDIAVGQMDNDPALEIALTDGSIIDTGTHTVQWRWANGFGAHLKVADIDNDNIEELIAADSWYVIWAYDIEQQLPKWFIPAELDIGAIEITDIDGDGVKELLVGDGQWGSIHAFNTLTLVEEWAFKNPKHGVTNIAVGDVDGNGTEDLLWGAGATSTGSDRLYVTDWKTSTILWENLQLDGPFIGPVIGDLDGDGIDEIVVASTSSESGYESGRIVVFDSSTLTVRGISPGIARGNSGWIGVHDLDLGDIDGDGRPEVLVAGDSLYDGIIEAYRFNANNQFTLVWTNATRPEGAPFYSVGSADVDGDGKIELIGGGGREHTGAEGVYIYIYDYESGAEKWHTPQMGGYWSNISGLAIADADGDSAHEIVGMVESGDVYIFDGTTHELKGLIPAQGTSLSLANILGTTSIVIGDATGNMSVYVFNGTSYTEVINLQLAKTVLDGITFSKKGALWAGSNGVLTLYALGASPFRTENYGIPFGTSVIMIKPSTMISAGSYGVHAFHAPKLKGSSPIVDKLIRLLKRRSW